MTCSQPIPARPLSPTIPSIRASAPTSNCPMHRKQIGTSMTLDWPQFTLPKGIPVSIPSYSICSSGLSNRFITTSNWDAIKRRQLFQIKIEMLDEQLVLVTRTRRLTIVFGVIQNLPPRRSSGVGWSSSTSQRANDKSTWTKSVLRAFNICFVIRCSRNDKSPDLFPFA